MCNYPESCPLSAAGEFGGNSWPPSSRRALTDDITGEQVNATWDYQYVAHKHTLPNVLLILLIELQTNHWQGFHNHGDTNDFYSG